MRFEPDWAHMAASSFGLSESAFRRLLSNRADMRELQNEMQMKEDEMVMGKGEVGTPTKGGGEGMGDAHSRRHLQALYSRFLA